MSATSPAEELGDQLVRLAAEIFCCSPALLKPLTTAADIPRWDSVNHVRLLVAAEEAFGLRFSATDFTDPANWGEFVHMVAAKQSRSYPVFDRG